MKNKLLILLLLSIFLIAACTQFSETIKKSESLKIISQCGDAICDETESCNCQDCLNDARCDTGAPAVEEIKEICGEDDENCCGNGKCETGERCNEETHLTACSEDCGRTCPHFVRLFNLNNNDLEDVITCDNCIVNGNEFLIKETSKIQIGIENVGERASSILTASFNCFDSAGDVAFRRDLDEFQGLIVDDYFRDGEDELSSVNSIVTGNNRETYTLEFMYDNVEKEFDINCNLVFSSQPDFKDTRSIEVKVRNS